MAIDFSMLFIMASSFLGIDLKPQIFNMDPYPRIRGGKQPYINFYRLGQWKVEFETIARTHAEDVALQLIYKPTVNVLQVDEEAGIVKGLSSPGGTGSLKKPYGKAIEELPGHACHIREGREDHFPGKIPVRTTKQDFPLIGKSGSKSCYQVNTSQTIKTHKQKENKS